MALFIIGLVLLVVGLFLFALALGRGRGLKWASKQKFTTENPNLREAIAEVNNKFQKNVAYEREQNGSVLSALACILIWAGFVMFAPGFSFLREYYVKQYCEGKIVWMEPAYVDDNGEVRPDGHRKLVKVKNISDRRTLYLQKDTTSTE